MSHVIILTIAVLVLVLFFTLLFRCPFMTPLYLEDDEEVVTTTTTTTVNDGPPEFRVVGNLKRQVEGIQSFAIDPVDGQKVWLNSNDDLYEDAENKVWRLV